MSFATDDRRARLFSRSVGTPPSISEHAQHYLDAQELATRRSEARERVIKIIRFNEIVLIGKGYCHQVKGLNGDTASLARYIDELDNRRSEQVSRQRELTEDIGLLARGIKLRSPQNLKRRRSALFGGQDLPINIFEALPSPEEVKELVGRIRRNLIHDAVKELVRRHEIEYVGGVWNLKPSVADVQRLERMRRRNNNVKQDDRSFHGRPNRDR